MLLVVHKLYLIIKYITILHVINTGKINTLHYTKFTYVGYLVYSYHYINYNTGMLSISNRARKCVTIHGETPRDWS